MLEIIIIIIILFLITMHMLCNVKEHYATLDYITLHMYGMPKFVKLNDNFIATSVSIFKPKPNIGESRCYNLLCPDWIPSDSICYKCK